MTDPSSSSVSAWLGLAILGVVLYRAAMAAFRSAFHALPSLQRRRMLEEGSVADPLLASLLEQPHILGMGITLWSQGLLALLLVLLWPLHGAIPGGGWVLAPLTLAYVWVMDLALPILLTGGDPATWVKRLFPYYAPMHQVMAPLIAPIARRFAQQREARDKDSEDDAGTSEDAVTALLEEGEAEGILEETDSELIRNVVTFGDTVVREVMTPRTRIRGLSAESGVEGAWEAFRETLHSRLPLFEGSIDRIVGVLVLKDLVKLPKGAPADLRRLMKAPLFLPESKPVRDVLRELQRARTQMAVVVDEFGTVSGLVTMEDLLEEVFGEIQDEHEAGADIQEPNPVTLLVAGQVHGEDLAERLRLSWERDGFDTVAGLVMARMGHVPVAGEQVAVEGAHLTVLRMEGPRILQVKVEVCPEDGTGRNP